MSTADPGLMNDEDFVAYQRELVEEGEVAANTRVRQYVEQLRKKYDSKRASIDYDLDRLQWIKLSGRVEALGEVVRWLEGGER